jgi:Predicted hydrolase of the metallo-beta-lactamase superfamily
LAKALKVIFLGGVGEIGKNMTALEYNDSIIIVDCGMSFPTEDTPGIDVVIPDITYLKQNSEKIKGIFLTHGHEDHIGAIPYVLQELSAPIYGTPFSLAIVNHKLEERNLPSTCLKKVSAGDTIQAGCFQVEFIKVCHSIAEASALAITTPVGVVFVTGDFKIDFTPIDGKLTDMERITQIGKKGVLLMLGESTNVEREGHTMSERVVGDSIEAIFIKKRNAASYRGYVFNQQLSFTATF